MDTFVHMPAKTAVNFALRPQTGSSAKPGSRLVSVDVTLVVGDPMHYGPRPGSRSVELSKPLSERTVALSVNGKTAFASRVPAHCYGIITITDCPARSVKYTKFGLESQVPFQKYTSWDGWRDGDGVVLCGSGKSKKRTSTRGCKIFAAVF